MKTVLVTDHVFPNLEPEKAILGDVATIVRASSEDEFLSLARRADAVLNCYRKLSPDLINSMENCRIIARYGIGVDTIPIDVATARGIQVTNVPDYCIEEVADHSLALMLALTRGIVRGLDQTRAGGWDVKALRPIYRQRGRILGLVGFGRIARALAARAKALGYEVIAFDPHLPQSVFVETACTSVDLPALLQSSDVVSLHAPLTPETHHLINKQQIEKMRTGAILINTSRGGLVDYSAVIKALNAGKLGGAGLDVLEQEPPQQDNEPLQILNLIVTPHLGFYSEEALTELQRKAAMQVRDVIQGRKPEYAVNRV